MKRNVLLVISILLCFFVVSPLTFAEDPPVVNQYRVFSNTNIVQEFADQASAIAFAQTLTNAHVEKITGQVWIWDNFKRYQVYMNGYTNDNLKFVTFKQAKAVADKKQFAQIRDLQKPGWVQATFPNFQLYRGEVTNATWKYKTLAEAQLAVKKMKMKNAHIINLNLNTWAWDNITKAQIKIENKSTPKYIVKVKNKRVINFTYRSLKSAITAARKIPDSYVYNKVAKKEVFSNRPTFLIMKDDKVVAKKFNIYSAIVAAKKYTDVSIFNRGHLWWTNVPYYKVTNGTAVLQRFDTHLEAFTYAKKVSNSSITEDGGNEIWTKQKLFYMGWHGGVSVDTMKTQLANTAGLDISSPTWFSLKTAAGELTDLSDDAFAASMIKSGLDVYPLVHNRFNKTLTHAFLTNSVAQTAFTNTLINRLVQLKVQGVNIDFEAVGGADRDLLTTFIKNFTTAAHKKNLKVSMDIQRGDKRWNAKTAYDTEELAKIVDYIAIMAYDQHWSGSTVPGSVAELDWVEEGIQDFLSYGTPRSKLILGVPFYTRVWKLDASNKLVDNKTLLMKNTTQLILDKKASSIFDPESGQLKYTYKEGGYTYVLWAETTNTVKARVNLARKYALAGVSAWRFGYEDKELWEALLPLK